MLSDIMQMDAGMRERQTPVTKDALIRENGCSLNGLTVWMEGCGDTVKCEGWAGWQQRFR